MMPGSRVRAPPFPPSPVKHFRVAPKTRGQAEEPTRLGQVPIDRALRESPAPRNRLPAARIAHLLRRGAHSSRGRRRR